MPEESRKNNEDPQSFEDAMDRLAEIVEKLEAGEGSLSEMTSLFEEGVRLSNYCAQELDNAEKKVQILLGENEEDSVPFDPEAPSISE